MQYIIAPIAEAKANFSLSASRLVEQIRGQWPEAEVTSESAESIVSWRILLDDYPLIGDAWTEEKVVVLDGDTDHVARFAVWYRSLFTENERLWIFDDLGNHEPYEIRLDTTQEQIVQALT
jgi:hypothetical protein